MRISRIGCDVNRSLFLYSHNRVPKQTSWVEVRKPPNLCCAIRSLFCFHHTRFWRFVTPWFVIQQFVVGIVATNHFVLLVVPVVQNDLKSVSLMMKTMNCCLNLMNVGYYHWLPAHDHHWSTCLRSRMAIRDCWFPMIGVTSRLPHLIGRINYSLKFHGQSFPLLQGQRRKFQCQSYIGFRGRRKLITNQLE